MRKTLVLFFWLVATLGVTYVANAAVQLVDRQVLPAGSQIQVLSFPEKTRTPPLLDNPGNILEIPTETSINSVFKGEMDEIANRTTTTLPIISTTVVIDPEPEPEPDPEPEPEPEPETEEEPEPETETEEEVEIISATTTTEAVVTTTTFVPATSTTTAILELNVLTTSLNKAKIGTNYGFQLLADGGIPPYRWSIMTGELPQNLEISENGYIAGVFNDLESSFLVFEVKDSRGKTSISREITIEIEPNRKTVIARGGTAFIDIDGDLVSLFLVSPADGYSAVIVEPGGFRVEVQFVPIQGDSTSYVVCEVNDGVTCRSDQFVNR